MLYGIVRFFKTILKIIFKHPVTGTTLIPILPDGRLILVKRTDTKKWSLPGGLVDWGQDIPTTAKRELKEETGLNLIKINRLVGIYSSFDRDPRLHSITVVLEVLVDGEIKLLDRDEILEIGAFYPNEIPLGYLSHDHDQQLENYFNNQTTIA